MSHPKEPNWNLILRYAENYPSPLNTQPIKVKILDAYTIEMYYDHKSGIPPTLYGPAYVQVCVGVFAELLSIIAHNLGYTVQEQFTFAAIDTASSEHLHKVGTLHLKPGSVPELITLQDIDKRQTSRLAYNKKLVGDDINEFIGKIAEKYGFALHITDDKSLVKDIISLNVRTFFTNLKNKTFRQEMKRHMRFTEKEAREKQDGIQAKSLPFPARPFRLLLDNYYLKTVPLIGERIKTAYLRTLKKTNQIGWLTGRFGNAVEHTNAGRCLIRIWLLYTHYWVYIHPLSWVFTNPQAHKEFSALVEHNEQEGFIWMLFRFGYSKPPPKSHRRNFTEFIIK